MALIELSIRRKGGSRTTMKDAEGQRHYHFRPQLDTKADLNDPLVYKNYPHVCNVSHKGDLKKFLGIDGYDLAESLSDPQEEPKSLPAPTSPAAEQEKGQEPDEDHKKSPGSQTDAEDAQTTPVVQQQDAPVVQQSEKKAGKSGRKRVE